MDTDIDQTADPARKRRFDALHITLFVLVAILLTAVVTFFVLKLTVFRTEFKPVTLNAKEEQVLTTKLQRLDTFQTPARAHRGGDESVKPGKALEPEAYSEEGAKREISLSERELNALVAKNTDIASRLALDLSGDLVSAKLLVPMDEDFPLLGGKTLKVRAGVELAYRDSRPVVVLKGISVMGVPLPNAWIGGLKNIDLVREFGGEQGFWKSFADGVENIHIEEGQLVIKLKE